MRFIIVLALLLIGAPALAQQPVVINPSSSPSQSIDATKSTAAEASRVLKAAPGNLYSITTTIGASTGYLMLFDATAEPANGSVSPKWWWPILSNGSTGGVAASWLPGPPLKFTTGITAVFSSTGPFTKTGHTSAAFSAQVQ